MKRRPTDSECEDALLRAGGVRKIAAEALGLSESAYRRRLQRIGTPKVGESSDRYSITQTGDFAVIEWTDPDLTVEDAIKRAGFDSAIWMVDKVTVNRWDVTMKLRGGSRKDGTHPSDTPFKTTNQGSKVVLKRRVPQSIEDASRAIIDRMKKHSPPYKKLSYPKVSDPHMVEFSLFDHHFGKLAWHRETENNYDLQIAEALFMNAVTDLLAKVRGFPIEKIILPIGQDFFHIDSPKNQTFKETPQDVDGRYAKIFEVGTMAVVKAIDTLQRVAPIEVIYSRGNHDPTMGWHLVKFLEAWYRKSKAVTIDSGPKARKYVHYGCVLIGFTHGDEEKHDRLPTIMASEVPDLWAKTTFREWHTGHFHKRKETRYTSTDSHVGITVRTLPSLSGTDYWHYLKGYVNSNRAAEAYLWSKANGYTGHFSSNARVE